MIPYEIDTNFSGVHKVIIYPQENFKLETNILVEGNIVQSNSRFQSEHWPDGIIYDIPSNKDLSAQKYSTLRLTCILMDG